MVIAPSPLDGQPDRAVSGPPTLFFDRAICGFFSTIVNLRHVPFRDGGAVMAVGSSAFDLAELRHRAERVRAQTTLSSVIGRDVKLAKRAGEHVGLCPFHAEKTGSFSINDKKGIYQCFGCGAGGDVFTYLEARKGMSFMQALRALSSETGIDFGDAKAKAEFDRQAERRARADVDEAERKRLNAWYLWKHAVPIEGTPAEAYLRGRGIAFERLGGYPRALRYRHDCWNTELGRGIPAMVAAMIRGSEHAATHRTYLELTNGQWGKAAIVQPKMTLGRFMGAHIPLNKGACGRMPLHAVPAGTEAFVAEGIEDGLTVAQADTSLRVVAAATLGNIGQLDLPAAVTGITLIEQNDDEVRALRARAAFAAGDQVEADRQEDAAMKIDAVKNSNIAAHQAAGRTVSCIWPSPGFKDFNDELMGKRMGVC